MHRWARALLVVVAVALAAACGGPTRDLDRAAAKLTAGQADDALLRYGRLADSPDASVRVRASVGAARCARKLGDERQRRFWLERAVAPPEVAGASEEAYLDYAEYLRTVGERSLALNFYYRAASLAEKSQGSRALYDKAVAAIATMGMTP